MHRISTRRLLLLAVTCLLLAACDMGGAVVAPTPVPTVLPTPTPTPAELSAQIGQATQASPSVHFEIALSGKPVFADDTQLFAISSIVGDLKRPDGVLATLKVSASGGLSDIKSVSLAGKQYITNPITLAWQCLPPDTAFDPAILFDPNKGFEHLLQSQYQNVALIATEALAGKPNYHLRGTLPGQPLHEISGGLLGAGDVKADLWADAATKRASQLILVDSASDATSPTTWTIVFSDYEKAVDVRAPPGTTCT
ncbi:MAG: LppX_LprAFG lipoprotein [Roseiflexaceae bacterium]